MTNTDDIIETNLPCNNKNRNIPTLSKEAKSNISMIANGLLHNNSNIEVLQQENIVLANTNSNTMQQLQKTTAQLDTM